MRRLVDRLKHRREVWTTSSEQDLKWVVVDEGDEMEEAVRLILAAQESAIAAMSRLSETTAIASATDAAPSTPQIMAVPSSLGRLSFTWLSSWLQNGQRKGQA